MPEDGDSTTIFDQLQTIGAGRDDDIGLSLISITDVETLVFDEACGYAPGIASGTVSDPPDFRCYTDGFRDNPVGSVFQDTPVFDLGSNDNSAPDDDDPGSAYTPVYLDHYDGDPLFLGAYDGDPLFLGTSGFDDATVNDPSNSVCDLGRTSHQHPWTGVLGLHPMWSCLLHPDLDPGFCSKVFNVAGKPHNNPSVMLFQGLFDPI